MDGSLTNVVVRLDAVRPVETARPDAGWLPAESALPMPRHPLQGADARAEAAHPAAKPVTSPAHIALRRFVLFACTFLLAGVASVVPFTVYARQGWEPLEVVSLGLFGFLILGLSCWFCSATAGFLVLAARRDHDVLKFDAEPATPKVRTALLMPLYNEDARATFGRLAQVDASLAALGADDAFDIFVLSDTNNALVAAAEERCFTTFRAKSGCMAFYRRRAVNTERKPGNISDWVERFGGAYAHMIILDADSTMDGSTILKLVDAMERNPGVGLIQTVPNIVHGESLFARAQAFGVRLYGRVASTGLTWWTGSEGAYWGHNAIVRVKAFAATCGMRALSGKKPFGGAVLSHDVVEAALLRRAGWGVHIAPELGGSFEEAPPSVIEFLKRDRRWCQGNLQHLALLNAPGVHWINRLQFMMGCMAYIVSPLWFAFLWTGLLIEVGRAQELQIDVAWPRSILILDDDLLPTIFSVTITLMLLLGPKMYGFLLTMMRKDERRGFGGGRAILKTMALESVFSALLAPVVMVAHTKAVFEILTGRDAGWGKQCRVADGLSWTEAFSNTRAHMAAGAAFVLPLIFLPDLRLWFAPIVLPLLFAAPLAVFSSRSRLGNSLRAMGFLRTPEDTVTDEAEVELPSAELIRLRA